MAAQEELAAQWVGFDYRKGMATCTSCMCEVISLVAHSIGARRTWVFTDVVSHSLDYANTGDRRFPFAASAVCAKPVPSKECDERLHRVR